MSTLTSGGAVAPGTEAPAYPTDRGGCPFRQPAGLAEFRDRAPVARATFASGREGWLATGHAEVRAILRDPRFSVRIPGSLHESADVVKHLPGRGSLLWQDGEEHDSDRRLLAREFTVRRMNLLRPNIQRIVDEHIDRMLAARAPVDLVKMFAVPVPSAVISDLFGVPEDVREDFQSGAEAMMALNTDPEALAAAGMRVSMIVYQVIQRKRAEPGDDLISGLLALPDPEGVLTDEFLVTMASTLLIAAHDTTACMIGLGTALLLDNPDQLALLRERPDLVPGAVEEMLRYLSIAQRGAERVAVEDVEIAGVTIKAGDQVAVHIPGANLDPAISEGAEDFDVTRRPTPHVAFGFGSHQCIGQQLARIELQVVFETLLRRLPGLALAKPIDQIPFRDEMVFYGVHELPVTF
ncbi:cytochrome P450 [Actinokineospora bangkokensis]|uniref:Cytochrome n=1 Tax=Actinokineospora bangkokensis TaxID=1193682 RepID=A0A1Q9LNF9_9PSEU|nr:cytochrome P450 [Actinokineospora bangkokensis]OLR93560.1 hypothetical protein BJP25_14810 [Actinokineospora bangkokensis]